MEISVEISNLSKIYKLYGSSSDRLKEAFSLFGRKYHSTFLALDNVNLTIKRGETFSFVGKNGAGKSTLLKVIAGVVAPTAGNAIINGRVVALLELGAGFNPEMTGAENIYLFGAFHGVSRTEMSRYFDKIVEFADIGRFIDYAVKTYSSGMFVRLAFACSIHLHPEILVVDEALSVGDARFQQKCFKHIDGLKAQGTTIILVSHDLTLVKMVSDRACLIDNGQILEIGHPKDIVNRYFDLARSDSKSEVAKGDSVPHHCVSKGERVLEIVPGSPAHGEGGGHIESVLFETDGSFPFVEGKNLLRFKMNVRWDEDKIRSLAKSDNFENNLILGISLSDRYGNYIFGMTTIDQMKKISFDGGFVNITFEVEMPQLKTDDYLINASIAIGTQAHHLTIAWYESIHVLQQRSALPNVYGWMHPEYRVY